MTRLEYKFMDYRFKTSFHLKKLFKVTNLQCTYVHTDYAAYFHFYLWEILTQNYNFHYSFYHTLFLTRTILSQVLFIFHDFRVGIGSGILNLTLKKKQFHMATTLQMFSKSKVSDRHDELTCLTFLRI